MQRAAIQIGRRKHIYGNTSKALIRAIRHKTIDSQEINV